MLSQTTITVFAQEIGSACVARVICCTAVRAAVQNYGPSESKTVVRAVTLESQGWASRPLTREDPTAEPCVLRKTENEHFVLSQNSGLTFICSESVNKN